MSYTRSSPIEYRPDVDGLRAVAVLMVVAFHAFPQWLPGGFVGVDVFFVISGYLITSIILKDVQQGKFTFAGFYARRCRRILPALIVVLCATWIVGWFVLLGSELAGLGRHIVAGATFTSNLLLWLEAGYFDAAADFKPLLHLWSLGVEEQFYLFWPAILMVAIRTRISVSMVIAVLFALSLGLNLFGIRVQPSLTFYFLPMRFWELALGCALAYFAHQRATSAASGARSTPALSRNWRDVAAAAGAVMLLISGFAINDSMRYPGAWALLPTVASGLLIQAGPDAWFNRAILTRRSMVLIGLISYPLYLWHWPLLSFAHIVAEGEPTATVRTVAVVLSFLLAFGTWIYVERPVQHTLFGSREPKQRTRLYLQSGAAALVIAGALGLITVLQGGFAFRFPQLEKVQRQMVWDDGGAERCNRLYATDGICRSTGPTPQLIIWGESHAEMLLPGIATAARAAGHSMILIGRYGCPPLSDIELTDRGVSQRCSGLVDKDKKLIETRLSGARTVVLASRGPVYFSGTGFGIEREQDKSSIQLTSRLSAEHGLSSAQLFAAGYSRTISFLEAQGKEVVFFVDVPELGFAPVECVDVRPIRLAPKQMREPCGVQTEVVRERQLAYRAIVSELQLRHPRLRVFDSSSYLCSDQYCYGKLDGQMLYRDDDHLSGNGSRYIAKPLLQWLSDGTEGNGPSSAAAASGVTRLP